MLIACLGLAILITALLKSLNYLVISAAIQILYLKTGAEVLRADDFIFKLVLAIILGTHYLKNRFSILNILLLYNRFCIIN